MYVADDSEENGVSASMLDLTAHRPKVEHQCLVLIKGLHGEPPTSRSREIFSTGSCAFGEPIAV